MLELLPFKAVLVRDGVEWFSVEDVCKYLGLSRINAAVRFHPAEEVSGTMLEGTRRKVCVITTEVGVYRMLLKSRTPRGDTFRSFVAQEVLVNYDAAQRESVKAAEARPKNPWLA